MMITFPQATDYVSALLYPQIAFADSELQKAKVKADPFGMPVVSSGGFALTFFLETQNRKKLVIRCFKSDVANRKQRYAAISTFINHSNAQEFTAVEYIDQGILVNGKRYPIVKMPEVSGQALHKYIESNLQQPQQLSALAQQFSTVINKLEGLGVAHGDLQHGNILVTSHGIVLIDYDGMFVPALKGLSSVESGHRSYQHPARNAEFGPDLDRFSALAIYLALEAVSSRPSLWNKYSNGDNLLFRDEDFRNPDKSPLLTELASIGSLQKHVQFFRATCKLPLNKIPRLADFLLGRIPTAPVVPIVATTATPAYQIIDAQDLVTLLNNIGNIVQIVGQITGGRAGWAINNTPYHFLNFGDYKQDCLTLVIWADALKLFKQQGKNPDDYKGKRVRVTGQLSHYASRRTKKGQPQIVIELVTQIEVISNTQVANHSMIGAPPQLEMSSSTIDFGAITPGEGKDKSFLLGNAGQGTLTVELQNIPAWLTVNPGQVQCAALAQARIKLNINAAKLPAQVQQNKSTTLTHSLMIVSNGGTKTVVVKAEVVTYPALQLSATSLDFGEIKEDQNQELWLDVKNCGTGHLVGQLSTSATWLAVTPHQITCAPGHITRISIRLLTNNIPPVKLQPLNEQVVFQLLSDNVTITSNGGTKAIPVSAKVALSPILQVTPSKVNFGGVNPDQIQKDKLLLRNIGRSPLQGKISSTSPWLSITPAIIDCAPGQSVYITIQLQVISVGTHSLELIPKQYTYKLSIISNGGVKTVDVYFELKIPTLKPLVSSLPNRVGANGGQRAVKIRAEVIGPVAQSPSPTRIPAQRNVRKIVAALLLSIILLGLLMLAVMNWPKVPPKFDMGSKQPAIENNSLMSSLGSTPYVSPLVEPMGTLNPPLSTTNPTSAAAITAVTLPSSSISSTLLALPYSIVDSVEGSSKTKRHTSPRPLDCAVQNPIHLLSPVNSTSDSTVTFVWQWNGVLQKNCGFEVRVWREGEIPQGIHDVVSDNLNGIIQHGNSDIYALHVSNILLSSPIQAHDGEYYWTVVFVQILPDYQETALQAEPQRFRFRLTGD